MIKIKPFQTKEGVNPFFEWLQNCNTATEVEIYTALKKLANGNIGKVQSLRGGLYEYKISHGSGIRIYFGYENEKIIIVCGGGDKKSQTKDIKTALGYWQEHKAKMKALKEKTSKSQKK